MAQLNEQFSIAERDRRWAAVRALMRRDRLDVIVVPNNTGHSTDFQANARYLTHVGGGSDADVAAVFPLEGQVAAVANGANKYWGQPEVQSWTTDLREARRNYGAATVAKLKELKVERGRIGITGLGPGPRTPMGTILLGFYHLVRDAFPEAELIDATPILEEVRYVKSEEEIAVLARSTEIIDRAIEAEIALARPGVRDSDLWAEVMSTLLKNGSELPVHCNWATGPGYVETLTRPTLRRLERGDFIVNEIEASVRGYRAQGMQPVYVETALPVMLELMEIQREIYGVLMERLRPGVTVGELAALTESACARAAPKIGPAAGAVAGLNMHGRGQGDDGPIITQGQRRPEQLAVTLQANMVFIFKPYVRPADESCELSWGDTVVVTPNGGRRLGRRPHELRIARD